mgnify:CR=1 FL=1
MKGKGNLKDKSNSKSSNRNTMSIDNTAHKKIGK